MTNHEAYDQAFLDSLQLSADQLGTELLYESVPTWDSVGHMELVVAIEAAFDIMMETDDIIDFSSYEKGKEILAANYEIEF